MLNILYANEKQGCYPDSYYLASAEPLALFPSLKGDHKVDVCVVGGGFSGLSAALHLRQAGYRVALLDAHRVGWGASGRNGGQVGSGQRLDQMELTDLVGDDDARKLWTLGEDAKALVQRLIQTHEIDCDYRPGVIAVNHRRRFGRQTMRYVEFLQSSYNYKKIRYLPRDELKTVLATDRYFDGALDDGAGHLHPLKFAFGLVRACRDAGVQIFEKSEVATIDQATGVVVKTHEGVLRADFLVLAANGYLGGLNAHTQQRVMPINNYIIATAPLSEAAATSLIANNAAVADSKYVVNYFRLSKDRRLLFGGRESYRYRFPPNVKAYVRKAMLGVYPQLENTRIDFGWGGVLGITMNRMPHFEWLSAKIVTIGGYSGHGVALATLGGALAAEAIGGVAERFSLMEKVPTQIIPGGGRFRAPLLALGMIYYSLKDRL